MNLLLAPFSAMPESLVAFRISGGGGHPDDLDHGARPCSRARAARKWVKAVTNVNTKFLFTFLFIGWAIFFGITLQLVPHVGASSPYGSIGLIALFTGFFIMMGLLWAVIGE